MLKSEPSPVFDRVFVCVFIVFASYPKHVKINTFRRVRILSKQSIITLFYSVRIHANKKLTRSYT